MKLGARIFKTSLAIILSLYVASLLGLEPIVLAPLGAIFALQPSIYRSYQSILEQVQGNLIGAVIAILLTITLGNEPLVIGLAAIIVIIIHLKLKIESAIPLALVSAVVIMDSSGVALADVAITRFSLIMIGVFSAFMVNFMFVPPKYDRKLFHKVMEDTDDIIKWLKLITKHGSQHLVLKKDLERLENNRFTIDQYYIFYKEERVYLSKNRFKKARKLVAFRNMMATLDQATSLLKTLHHYENALDHLPQQLRRHLEDEIDSLTELHEQLLNIFVGKVRMKLSVDAFSEEVNEKKVKVTNAFFTYFKEQQDDELTTSFLPLLGALVKYSEELEHLNKLVNSYNTFHYEKIEEEE